MDKYRSWVKMGNLWVKMGISKRLSLYGLSLKGDTRRLSQCFSILAFGFWDNMYLLSIHKAHLGLLRSIRLECILKFIDVPICPDSRLWT
jgi:hypothetical protein